MGFTTGSSIFLFSNLAFLDLCWDYCVLIWCFRDLPTVTPTSCYAQMTSSFFLRMSDSLQLWLMAHLQSPYSTLIVNNQIFMYIGLGNLDQCLLSSNHRIPAHLCGTDVIVILPMNYRPCLSAWFWVYFSACSLCLCLSPSFPASTLWFSYARHLLYGGQAQSFLYLWKTCHPVMCTRNLSQKNKLFSAVWITCRHVKSPTFHPGR